MTVADIRARAAAFDIEWDLRGQPEKLTAFRESLRRTRCPNARLQLCARWKKGAVSQ